MARLTQISTDRWVCSSWLASYLHKGLNRDSWAEQVLPLMALSSGRLAWTSHGSVRVPGASEDNFLAA